MTLIIGLDAPGEGWTFPGRWFEGKFVPGVGGVGVPWLVVTKTCRDQSMVRGTKQAAGVGIPKPGLLIADAPYMLVCWQGASRQGAAGAEHFKAPKVMGQKVLIQTPKDGTQHFMQSPCSGA